MCDTITWLGELWRVCYPQTLVFLSWEEELSHWLLRGLNKVTYAKHMCLPETVVNRHWGSLEEQSLCHCHEHLLLLSLESYEQNFRNVSCGAFNGNPYELLGHDCPWAISLDPISLVPLEALNDHQSLLAINRLLSNPS